MAWNLGALKSVVLENDLVRLRRLSFQDKAGYARIAFDPDIWRYFVSVLETEDDLDAYIEQAVHDWLAGTRLVFTIVDRHSGRIAGGTAFGNLSPRDLRLEIGWSWVGREFVRSGVNRAAKALLLDYAFGTLECERVEFKTDVLNVAARRGLEGIGATEEGTLRSFNVMPGGRRRDAVYYSILRGEWPAIRSSRFGAEHLPRRPGP
ncbi:MAG: GNAT family N-acetyltransferase [Telmatospirillum sp.]|nr:GNAT family N-acetyltransferase [Telmatospirillum sp.]